MSAVISGANITNLLLMLGSVEKSTSELAGRGAKADQGGKRVRTKDFLRNAYKTEIQIQSKLEQIESMRSLVEKTTTALSDMPKGASQGSQLESIITKLIDSENELNQSIDFLIDTKAEVRFAIKTVEDPDLRLVLELRYLCYKPWSQISEEMCYDIRQIHRLHSKALFELENKRCH